MSILVNRETRVICQGFTGKQGTFHSEAALAYGTASIPRVDVIAGPGNSYVAEAKRQVSGVVGIASAFAGPSEIVVVAGPAAPPEFAALDLVVQAEHGPDGLAWLVTWDEVLLAAVGQEVDRIVAAFKNEILDQDLRGIIARETEGTRNAILAFALSKTGLQGGE